MLRAQRHVVPRRHRVRELCESHPPKPFSAKLAGFAMFANDGRVTARQAAVAALKLYGKRLDEAREAACEGELENLSSYSYNRCGPVEDFIQKPIEENVQLEIAREIACQDPSGCAAPFKAANVAFIDGEQVLLCQHCHLPLGELAYMSDKSDALMHGECQAQRMVRDMQADEHQRKAEARRLKSARRQEFDIGWTPTSMIPRNVEAAQKLGCPVRPQGLACLVMEGDSVRVAATLEPAAAVNLEYLSVALQVRRTEGKEPLFSLDPVDNGRQDDAEEASMQCKRFEPEWLAGTSLGEVMFQADYHLKELSFGEYNQPIVGMKSCFDYSETDVEDAEWSAREWFIVRKAEMHVSQDKVLVPYLKMGVEAREQVMGVDGLEDAAITRPDHPLVMYADAFTHNFDLIAERKSVVSQLREVAKASIMAKYLMESGTSLGDAWFGLGGTSSSGCCLEVPQLWNDRCFSKITLKDGAVQTEKAPKMHGLYGGVDFGIDRFRLAAPSRVATSVVAGRAVLGRPASTLMATSKTGLTIGPARQFARLSAPLSATMSLAASRAGLGVPRVAAGLSMGVPQGVDLNLDKFNLSMPADGTAQWGCTVQVDDAAMIIGDAFWSQLEAPSAFDKDTSELLKEVFNPNLSDRRKEVEFFTPPPTSSTYMQRLKNLVRGEQIVRQQRKEHFCSVIFKSDDPGPLFPSSWTASFGIERGAQDAERPPALRPHPEYLEANALREAVSAAAPSWQQQAEDGTVYRVYRLGSLEVRTMQEYDGEEVMAMAFSSAKPCPEASESVDESELVVKATEFAEFATGRPCHLYTVLVTDAGHVVVVEQDASMAPKWSYNPPSVQDRNSLAKVIRTTEGVCAISIGQLKAITQEFRQDISATGFAQLVYCLAAGDESCPASGFRQALRQRVAHVRAF